MQVLEVTISVFSDVYYIDLDDEEFKQKWNQIRASLEQRANEIWKKYRRGNAKKRHNIRISY